MRSKIMIGVTYTEIELHTHSRNELKAEGDSNMLERLSLGATQGTYEEYQTCR